MKEYQLMTVTKQNEWMYEMNELEAPMYDLEWNEINDWNERMYERNGINEWNECMYETELNKWIEWMNVWIGIHLMNGRKECMNWNEINEWKEKNYELEYI